MCLGTEAWVDASGYLRQKDYIADKDGYRILKSKVIFIGKNRPIKASIFINVKKKSFKSLDEKIIKRIIYVESQRKLIPKAFISFFFNFFSCIGCNIKWTNKYEIPRIDDNIIDTSVINSKYIKYTESECA